MDGLIEEANRQLSVDIRRAVSFAQLAVVTGDALENRGLSRALARDFQARARVGLSRAQRRAGDLSLGHRTLREAERLLCEGTGDQMELAALLEEKALLHRSLGQIQEALWCLDRSVRIYRGLRDGHLQARAQIRRADVLDQVGEYEGAIRTVAHAIRQLDPQREPRCVLTAVHNLALSCAKAGQTQAARTILVQSDALYAALSRPVDLLRARWLVGSILLEEGNVLEAGQILADVRTELVEYDLPVEAACSSLELALALAKQGRAKDVSHAVLAAIPVFESRRIGGELLLSLTNIATKLVAPARERA